MVTLIAFPQEAVITLTIPLDTLVLKAYGSNLSGRQQGKFRSEKSAPAVKVHGMFHNVPPWPKIAAKQQDGETFERCLRYMVL